MPLVLTRELVSARSKCDNLSAVRNLNVWGSDLEDLQILRQLPNVEILSLSINKISTLKDFSNCKKLQEIYLRKNSIRNLSELKHLANLPNLRVLWLQDNPCTNTINYRGKVAQMLPALIKLDDQPITFEERQTLVDMEDCNEVFSTTNALRDPNEDAYAQNRDEIALGASKKFNTTGTRNSFWEVPEVKERVQNNMIDKGTESKMRATMSRDSFRPDSSVPMWMKGDYEEHEKTSGSAPKNNIVSAISTLIQDLDVHSLELIKKTVERKIASTKGQY